MRSFPAVTLAVLAAVAACQQSETTEHAMARMAQESEAAKQAIVERNAQFGRYVAAGQADSVAGLYTEDAELLPPNGAAVRGRANIEQGFAGMMGGGKVTIDLTAQDVVANGPMAVERGAYVLTFTPGPNAPKGAAAMADTGKYLVHWHQQGGAWYMAHDIWNSNRPAAQ